MLRVEDPRGALFVQGGLFLDQSVPASLLASVSNGNTSVSFQGWGSGKRAPVVLGVFRRRGTRFLSVSLSVKGGEGFVGESVGVLGQDGKRREEENGIEEEEKEGRVVEVQEKRVEVRGTGAGAMNTTKHLWAGAVAAMVSRTFVAPLERLKLEYIVRGEQRNLFELIKHIATTQGLRGFWKGNFVNILRTAPFKAVNFYAYDTYRKQLLKFSGNEETTNFERFVAGAAAGITAAILCIPLDTIRTKMIAPGGEALGGVIGVFRHMVQTEGFFSLYKGLVPSLVSMAPSGAVFYGVYDILKSAYLHSPEGIRRTSLMKQQEGEEMSALDQLELGPARTLIYGAISGACAEAATYPFEVVRRHLQMQVQATKLNAFATCMKIVEKGGIPALYAGLIPSLLQVLPSAAISYFVYDSATDLQGKGEYWDRTGRGLSSCLMAEGRRYAITPQLDISQIILEAQHRWLRPAEICEILRNYQNFHIAPEPANKPASGSLFLFDRKVLRYFRKDGHNWRKKRDGKTVKEAHERLKSGSVDVLHCYYAHGEENENFQRRSYWMLEEDLMHIVLVHYREVKGNKSSYRSTRESEDNSQVTHLDGPVFSNSFTHQSRLLSQTTEAESANSTQTSEVEDAESDNYQASSRYHSYPELQRCVDGPVMDAPLLNHHVSFSPSNNQFQSARPQAAALESGFYQVSQGDTTKVYDQMSLGLAFNGARTQFDSACWNELLEYCNTDFDDPFFRASVASMQPVSLENNTVKESLIISGLGNEGFNFKQDVAVSQDQLILQGSNAEVSSFPTLNVDLKTEDLIEGVDNDSSIMKHQSLDLANIGGEEGLKKYDSFSKWMSKELEEVEDTHMKSSSGVDWDTVGSGNVEVSNLSNHDLLDPYLMAPSLSQDQLFSIIDFSPNWAYTDSGTKVIVTGKFLKDKQDLDKCKWSCMFGEIEVPAEILADGVLRCLAPPHTCGRVPFYITCSNRLACSEVREFEYCMSHVQHMETSDSYLCCTNEMSLSIRLERLLSLEPATSLTPLSNTLSEKHDLSGKISSLLMESEDELCDLLKLNQDATISPDNVKNHLLEKLLKDKLHVWLLHKLGEDGKGPNVLDTEGQGVLHLASALGYDWAIEPTITAGVSINFRDVHGWTALHWAAFCGRERTVVTLITLGADPRALTDPTPEFPTGRTASDLASANNHKGIGGFLAESSLTSHLSTLGLKDLEGNDITEISGLSSVEDVAEKSVVHLAGAEEHATISMKDSLSAVRNAALTAARIHEVLRVQSFQRKKLVEIGNDKCGISDESVFSLLSVKASRPGQHDLSVHAAVIKIQNKFRGWKDRKLFLIIRKRIVMIQAHVRGHQVRKHYRKIVWSVGIVEKAILRWRRKRIGLRGFRSEGLLEGPTTQNQSSTDDDYDFLKEGRKQTEARLEKALARVKSMVQYPEARDQYHRLLKVVTELQESKAMQESFLNGPEEAVDGDFMIGLEELLENSP
ncbi:hypothetical protein J5N97_005699 [Dioscorea zingiberensis]|uniref:CG-1 domain-containing protein n=1 Tax=Dioscorea zingiberensis TaxID=325984 RepID=A0A9D5D8U5_9LILI|nr:hypothetical protein J5N97_005699 [Dioscorea zingiberensis]